MNVSKLICYVAMGALLGFAATGCKSRKPSVTPLPAGSRAGMYGNNNENGIPGGGMFQPFDGVVQTTPGAPGGGEAAAFDPDQMNQDRNALAAETVYFGYDSSAIQPGEESKVEAVASALRSDAIAKLLIEGHCDERGTEEYNRSLGERRALAVREALAARGIDAARIATRSYGEDRPAVMGQGEDAWSRNRRAEFVLLHPR